ncbi:DUF881 domain-containing protein [Schnuerera sp. xch1]|uniref:DUF881 domain-containing protein n=1 Tax=Schnuerera sp. xch1 TaxID=2874283 RepID=UPI001CC162D1|nr:DUF881 domain-containing protein [Schnuerera sp. xch1]MBZ2173679.1 DUF881 domain-containing protein [Schnuerera sp. xch1]
MKSVKKTNLVILCLSVLLGIVIAVQLKQNVPDLTPVTLNAIEMTKYEIEAINKEVAELKVMIKDKEKQIEMYKSISSGDKNIIDILNNELEKNRITAGFEEVQGPGIIVKMEDNMDENAFGQELDLDLIHDADVLRIINDLRGAGAEAISINGQRVLAISEIKCGGPIIRINNNSVATPIHITAIGDPKLLNAAICAPNTYGYALKTIDQINIETSMKDKVVVPAYIERFDFQYAKPIKEGD